MSDIRTLCYRKFEGVAVEHHGLNRCVDKGLYSYKRYTGLSVLAYNLHLLGNCLIEQEKQQQNKRLKKQATLYKKAA
jgi:hypothetical protein